MALAMIRQLDKRFGQLKFACEIGTNSYYQMIVGDYEDIKVIGGLSRIEGAVVKSKMHKLPDRMLGRFVLNVPLKSFPKGEKYIQLLSYKNLEGRGKAWSNILKIKLKEDGRR